MSRKGPGLLLRDLLSGKDAQAAAVARIVAHVAPDVLVLQGIDYDLDGLALRALSDLIAAEGHALPYRFAARPNTGMATGLDMDGDGWVGDASDAQGYGRFAGEGGMAVLSRLPVIESATRDFTATLWADLPGHIAPRLNGAPFPDAVRFAQQRLSTTAHWDVALRMEDGTALHLLTWYATPPVFDGPEDRNGRRNHDEAAFWLRYLDGALPWPPPDGPLVVIGGANLDPEDGDGLGAALLGLLQHPRLTDPAPASHGAVEAARVQGGTNAAHHGDPARDTADWDDAPGDPGNLRVDYVLPDRQLEVLDAGVFWPAPDDPDRTVLGEDANTASHHRLVWVDVRLQHD